ncbi:uncharacterized protein [Amphiura filiformis]|uniref:uncharacterized protein n=1 Tax=Amphiura filiformis TaxID=82378 RepID=UPI003B2205F0
MVEPKKKVQPEPEKVITVQKGPEKVKVKPEPKKVTKVVKVSTKVKKPKKGAKAKTRKEKKRKPEISQDTDDSSEEEELSPTPEPYIIESPSPSLESESTPPPSPSQVPLPPSLPPTPSQIALPPSPTPDQIPLPPSLPPTPSPTPPPPEPTPPPPKEPTPLPPKEPTPPPPKEPTPPPPPPKEPTPPPPVKKPKVATPKPKPPVSKPVKPKKAMKPKREKKKPVANRKVINKTKPVAKPKTEKPLSPKEENNEQVTQQEQEEDETKVATDTELEDTKETEAPPVIVEKPKKIPKLPKAVFKKKVPLIIKEFVRKEKTISAAWLLPKIPKWKEGTVDMPSWPAGVPPEIKAMLGGSAPPLPDIAEPKPKTPEPEPEPAPKLPPAPKVVKRPPEPIVWRKRREYKPKKRKIRAVKAESPSTSPEPVIRDALDFLSKYCIVHKERVPLYQHVFYQHLAKQGVIIDPEEDDDDDEEEEMDTLPERHYRLKSLSGSEIDTNDIANTATTDPQNDGEFEETFKRAGGEGEGVNENSYVSPLDLTSTEKVDVDDAGSGASDDDSGADALSKVVFANPPLHSLAVDDQLDKIAFTMDHLYQKTVKLEDEILKLGDTRKAELANLAREEFPEILRADYNPNSRAGSPKKEKKGKKKTSKGGGDTAMIVFDKPTNNILPSTLSEVDPTNDDWVLGRLNETHNKQLESMPEVRTLTLRLNRANEKLNGAKKRTKNLLKEKDVMTEMGKRLRNQESSTRPAANEEFRRKQSSLYKEMNPETTHDIGIKDVEPLMRQVNRNLITDKECQYVYHVLDLPQRHRLDFKLFTVVAALSEKVSNLEPFIRKMINKMDFEALDVKMSKAKELFYLLEDEDSELCGSGEIPLYNMKVELEAGGLSPEHVKMVVDKLGREGKQTVDFLDFLTYILLFVDIHDYILSDPLNASRDR